MWYNESAVNRNLWQCLGKPAGRKLSEESFPPDPFSKTFIPFLWIGATAPIHKNKVKFSEGSLRENPFSKGFPSIEFPDTTINSSFSTWEEHIAGNCAGEICGGLTKLELCGIMEMR